ncbi:hypothetical protein GUJ93_ZPchr0006g41543 [Zizania palustris]|uniref:Uncharacterized protein n=1 Tax=Zizania palustris TaxID=103762 RepID=A0A8J5TD86_ZIZPA|nr:hypothetical protein GUJ93_ZPchr0006g41543 [Zizania palustris]
MNSRIKHQYGRPTNRQYNRLIGSVVATSSNSGQAGSSASAISKTESRTVRLSPVDIAQRRKEGKYFYCDEPFTAGHKSLFKHLFNIEVLGDEEDNTQSDMADMAAPCSYKSW